MIHESINGVDLNLITDYEVFSPKNIDLGTKAMLSFVKLLPNDKVLDLGCGYGVVGIWAAKQIGASSVTMTDINPKAVECAKENAILNQVFDGMSIVLSDGLKDIMDSEYTLILSNPPYHVDFSVPKQFIEQGHKKLALGGRMLMVVKRKDWYQNKLSNVFGGVKVYEKDGYYILEAQKREKRPAPKKEKPALSKKLQRKYAKR